MPAYLKPKTLALRHHSPSQHLPVYGEHVKNSKPNMNGVSVARLFVVAAALVFSSTWAHPSTSPNEERRQVAEPSRPRSEPRSVPEAVPAVPAVDVDVSLRQHEERKEIRLHEQTEILKTKTEETLPTVRCAEIIPEIGEPSSDNHDACHAHCVTLTRDYESGKCLRGVCHCRLRGHQPSTTPALLNKIEREGHPAVRCEHIVLEEIVAARDGARDAEACRSHCITLGREFASGECLRGICYCKKLARRHQSAALEQASAPAVSRETATKVVVRPSPSHPTVKCEHLVPLNGEPSSESHGLCHAHCRTLGEEFARGECLRGVCHCERRPDSRPSALDSGLPTVRCEHIVPIAGQPAPENHEACSSHCVQIGGRYEGGECVSGVCKCKLGVSKTAVPPTTVVRDEVVVVDHRQ